ncbi:MAG: type II toxin-antitoxin system prevent-host-death family antitoxin [Rhodospirillales bacterium]
MAIVGSFEAKTHFAELVSRAERGEEIIITRRGKPVARLVLTERGHDARRRTRRRGAYQGAGSNPEARRL